MDPKQILEDLDKHAKEFNFPVLDNAYVEFAGARLSAFRSARDWLIAFEVLGFSVKEVVFVNDLYAYGSCVAREGFISEQIPFTSTEENPLFDVETNECIADWSRWSIEFCGKIMSFSPIYEEYAQAGIFLDRSAGPGSLKEIELLRFLAHRLGTEKLLMCDQALLGQFPQCMNLSKFFQTTQWQHPDISDAQKPSNNVSIRSMVRALSRMDPLLFMPGQPNTDWKSWTQPR